MAYTQSIQIEIDSTGAVRSVKKLDKSLEDLNKAQKKVKKETSETVSAFDKLKGALFSIQGAVGAIGLGAIAVNMARVARETENFKAILKTATGSIDQANIEFDKLNKFAATTPYTLEQSVRGFVQLKNLGLDPSEKAMKSYGNTAAAMGKDLSQMIEAVADAATGEFERLKEFGIRSARQGDQVSFTFRGVTETIKNSSADIQQYLMNIGETNFATAMEDQMNTIDGQLSNLKQSFDDLWRAMGEGLGITEFVKSALEGLSGVVKTLTFAINQLAVESDMERIAKLEHLLKQNEGATKGAVHGFNEMGVSVEIFTAAMERNANQRLEYTKELETLQIKHGIITPFIRETAKAIEEAGDAADKTSGKGSGNKGGIKGLKEELSAYQKVITSLREKEQDHVDILFDLNEAVDAGEVSWKEYYTILKQIGEVTDKAEGSTKKLATETKELAKTVETELNPAFEDLSKDIEGNFTGLFRDIFSGADDAFKNLADRMKDTFVNLLAELAYQATVGKIMVQVGMSGSGGGIASSLTGSGGGSSLLSGIPGIGNIGSSIAGGVNSLFGGGMLGVMGGAELAGPTMTAGAGLFTSGTGILGAIGSAVPYIGAALGLASAFGLFDSNSDVTPDISARAHSGAGWDGFAYNESDFTNTINSKFGNLSVGTQHDAFSSEAEARAFSDGISKKLVGMDNLIAKTVGDEVSGLIASGMEEFDEYMKEEDFSGSGDIQSVLTSRFTKIFDIIGGELDQAFDMLVGDFSIEEVVGVLSVLSEVSKNTVFSVGELSYALKGLDVEADQLEGTLTALSTLATYASQSLEEAFSYSGGSLTDQWEMGAAAIKEATSQFDMSIESLNTMAALATQNRQNELALLYQIKGVSEGLAALGADTVQSWKLQTMTDEEKYKYYDDMSAIALGKLHVAETPEEINEAARQATAFGNAAFGLLDDDEKLRLVDQYEETLNNIIGASQTKLSTLQGKVSSSAGGIQNSIMQAVRDMSIAGKEAADIQLEAAKLQQEAAATAAANLAYLQSAYKDYGVDYDYGQDSPEVDYSNMNETQREDLLIAGSGG